ncbi:MAG: LysM peptidoglycan-binding domain-containing protein [Bdellovibrionales bacterium]|nr:LysM peptidoglycan-binding domain-containing protein [Bdellovibrionales bacterium]
MTSTSLPNLELLKKMSRAFLVALLAGTMSLQVGCSSSDTAEDSSDESADIDSEDSGGEEAASEDSESSSESAESESGKSEDGEESAEADGEEAEEGGEEVAEKAEAGDGEEVAEDEGDEEEGEDGEAVAKQEAPPAPVEKVEEPTPPPPVADAGAESAPSEPGPEAAPEPPPMPRVSLKKIKEAPFDVGGTILNTVYLARPGDNVRGIAKKLGVGRNELVRWNSHIAGGVKTGDKVYYRSQTRPDDTSTMLTYYEDKGIAAQNYEAQEGENIRAIAKKVLGSSEGWKELWATNLQVESKGELPGGTVLRYWSEDSVATPVAAAPPPQPPAPPPPPPPQQMPPPPPVAQNPPPDQGLPQQPLDNTNPEGAAMGSVGAPPPPGPPRPKPKDVTQADALGLSEENIYLIGGGGLVLLTLLFMVAMIRKKKARQLADSQTQI